MARSFVRAESATCRREKGVRCEPERESRAICFWLALRRCGVLWLRVLATTGNVFSKDAVKELCFKRNCLEDLLDATPFKKEDYEKYKAEGRLIPQGVHVQWLSSHGPLSRLIGRDAE